MKCYVSFPDKTIFSGVALPEESLTTQSEEATPKGTQPVHTNCPVEEATAKITEEEPTEREQPPN